MSTALPNRACARCLRTFKPRRMWQRFCCRACRYGATRDELKAEYTCEYCGIVADTVDHVPPTSIRSTLIELNLHLSFPFIEVRACRECNSTLGDRGLWTLELRRQYVAERLTRRYRKYLDIPDWTSAELDALDVRLRQLTIQGLAVRDLARLRIARANAEIPLPQIRVPVRVEPVVSIVIPPTTKPAKGLALTTLELELKRTERKIARMKASMKE